MPALGPARLIALARQLAARGITEADVDQLVDAATDDGGIKAPQREALRKVLLEHADHFAGERAADRLAAFCGTSGKLAAAARAAERDDGVIDRQQALALRQLADAEPEGVRSLANVLIAARLTETARAELATVLDVHAFDLPHGERPVFLADDGTPLADPLLRHAQPGPAWTDVATGLFRLAELCADKSNQPFLKVGLPLREALLDRLLEALNALDPSTPPPPGLNEREQLAARASVLTCLLGLVESAGACGPGRDLLDRAFVPLRKAIAHEPDVVLRESMAFALGDLAPSLPGRVRDKAEDLAAALTPTAPPYESWFQGASSFSAPDRPATHELNISWTVGREEEFFRGTLQMLRDRGFVSVPADADRPPVFLEQTIKGKDDEDYQVSIAVEVGGEQTFKHMGQERVHIVGYDGHSDLGRAIPRALAGAPDATGDKLIFYGLCAGKDALERVRRRYDRSQVLTTFTSTFFNVDDAPDGGKVMTRSENLNVLMELIEGATERYDWATIHENISKRAILYPQQHVLPGGTNYLTPIHTALRRRVLDSDHDGVADVLDRHVQYDLHAPETDTARETEPIAPGRPANVLDGTKVHLATQALLTATGFHELTQAYRRGTLVGGGWFEPTSHDDPMVRFVERTLDDGTVLVELQANALYSHASVAALRAEAHYQLMLQRPDTAALPADERQLCALAFAAFSILYDEDQTGRDAALWEGLLATHGLPPVALDDARRLLDQESSRYAGTSALIARWKAGLDRATLDALAKA